MPPTTPATTPVAEAPTAAAPNPTAPTTVSVPAPAATVAVAINSVPQRFAPSVDRCAIAYTITGAATTAKVTIKNRANTVVAEIANAPHATGANTATWDGRCNRAANAWAKPHDSPYHVVVTVNSSVNSAPSDVLVEIESLAMPGAGPNAAHPNRLYRPASGGTDAEPFELTARVKLRDTAGAGVLTEVPMRVDWSVELDAGNYRGAGGKDASATFFRAKSGFTSTCSGGTAFGDTAVSGDGKGLHKVEFLASTIGGDRFVIVARVLQAPGGAALPHGEIHSARYEVWRRLEYNGAYRITGGVDVGALCAASNLQPVLDEVFVEYTLGTVHSISRSGEYLAQLDPPTADERPRTGTASAYSEAGDTRQLTLRGKIQTAHGTEDHAETHALSGEDSVSFTSRWQVITRAEVTPAAAQAVVVEAGEDSITIDPNQTSATGSLVFDTNRRLKPLAQAWFRRNAEAWSRAMEQVRPSGASGFILVGARLLHPKRHVGPAANTTYYEGFTGPNILIDVEAGQAHPDEVWHAIDGGALPNGTSMLFSNLEGSATYQRVVACHEVAHATLSSLRGGRTFGSGDHCANTACIMQPNATSPTWCESQSTRQRMKGHQV